jgi:hypothetical protein
MGSGQRLDMHSPWGSGRGLGIGGNSLVMSETGIPVGSPFPIGFGPREKSSPKVGNGDGGGEIFPRCGSHSPQENSPLSSLCRTAAA